MAVSLTTGRIFPIEVPVAIIGGGAAGLIAALAAHDAGADVLVIERDENPSGSTALSSGFIPACDTRYQGERGIVDSVENFSADIVRKNHGEADPRMVEAICRASGTTLHWLADEHRIPFVLLEGFLYPGHSVARMHAVPEKTGRALMDRLQQEVARCGIDVLTSAMVTEIYADDARRVSGLRYLRPDSSAEEVGCRALVLACSGFGGNRDMVLRYLPEVRDALYFGHVGNQGDAIRWGEALGASVRDLGAYQGHGSVATPHGILITWALMTEGGVQVNVQGRRFSNELLGYSEQCLPVIEQPGGVAWDLYDQRLHRLGMEFEDYRQAWQAGAVRQADSLEALAAATGLPLEGLSATLESMQRCARGESRDPYGREFRPGQLLEPPYFAVKVTAALFHTQGGLEVDSDARVLAASGEVLPNLFAAGGAARGVSGAHVWGYLSGNGLLAAVTLGRLAGRSAARLAHHGR